MVTLAGASCKVCGWRAAPSTWICMSSSTDKDARSDGAGEWGVWPCRKPGAARDSTRPPTSTIRLTPYRSAFPEDSVRPWDKQDFLCPRRTRYCVWVRGASWLVTTALFTTVSWGQPGRTRYIPALAYGRNVWSIVRLTNTGSTPQSARVEVYRED